jgi:NAD(P)-dependent dehydrogenase (short-subunit alcohol dehydrogenase family)
MGEWARAVAVNVVGTANACAVFLPTMAAAGGGSVVNFSGGGIGGPRPADHVSSYTASKGAVVVLTEVLALEAASLGIRVNAVAPGALATSFMQSVLDSGPDLAGPVLYAQAVDAQANPVSIEWTLALVRYLLSSDSAHFTGRFLSARWDDPASLVGAAVEGSNRTLRRVDDNLIVAVAPDVQ